MYVLYWIHYPHQKNPMYEGYIGITSNLKRRIIQHKSRNKLFKNRINKGAVVTTLYENLDYKLACCYEYNFRPYENLGWNIAKGGNLPPSKSGDKRSVRQKEADKIRSTIMKGKSPHNKTSVIIFGEEYDSITSAIKKLDITYSQYIVYIKSVQMFTDVNDLKKYCHNNRIEKISKSREKSNKVSRGIYHIVDPEGNKYTISNGIDKWCKVRGLVSSNLRRSGYSKGYTCSYEVCVNKNE